MNKPKIAKKISSLALGSSMLVMSLLPAASAFAATTPSVTLIGSSLTANAGGHVNFVASAHNVSNPEYQFWVETPSGKWIVGQNYSSNNSFTLSNVQNGDYLVNVDVLSASQVKAGQWSKAVNTLSKGVFVNSSVKVSGPSGTIQKGQKVTINAAASNVYSPLYQFWYQTPSGTWMQSGGYTSNNSYTFTATETGSYKFTAYAKSPMAVNNYTGALSAPAVTKKVHRDVTGVTVSGTKSFAAGSSTTLTAAATNNGVAVSSPSDVKWSVSSSNGNASNVTFGSPTSGKTSFNVPSSDPGTYTVTATVNGVTSKSYTINAYGQAAAVKLSPSSSKLVADGKATDTITATVVDSHGNPVGNFNGHVTIDTHHANTSLVQNGNPVSASGNSYNVKVQNGVARFSVVSKSTASSNTLDASNLTASGSSSTLSGINFGSASVNLTQPSTAGLTVKPTMIDVSNNSATAVPVQVNYADQAGNSYTGGSSHYVTLTLTGPGKFSNGKSTMSEYIPASGMPVNVYSETGVPGTITVTASASGLSNSSPASIQSVQTTSPASIYVTGKNGAYVTGNKAGLSQGTPFTEYTTQLVDKNGYAVVPSSSDVLTIKDTSTSSNTTLKYYAVNSQGQPTGSGYSSPSSLAAALGTTTGSFSFAVINTTAGSNPVDLSITDALTNTTKTVSYTPQVGSPAYAIFPGETATSLSFSGGQVEAGHSYTYRVQLYDANGNKLNTANQSVKFYFSGSNGAGATMNNSTGWSSSNPYEVTTNAQGQATVTVAVPSSASSSQNFTLNAAVPGHSGNAASTTAAVTSTPNFSSQVALGFDVGATPSKTHSLPSSMTAGQSLASAIRSGESNIYAIPENAAGSYTSSDQILITTSNPKVLSLGNKSNSIVQSASSALPITAKGSGSATVTITDLSNPNMPSMSKTITVKTGSAADLAVTNPDGTTNSNYAFGSSGLSGPYTINLTDAGGNAVGATSPLTLTANQVKSLLGITGQGITGIRTSSSGSDVSSVTIPQNQSSAQVWLDGVTKNNTTTETAGGSSLSHYAPMFSSASANASGSTVTVKFNNALAANASASALGKMFTVTNSNSETDGSWSNTPTSASVSGSTVTLTLADKIDADDNHISVAYAPATGGLQNGYDVAVGSVSTQPVTLSSTMSAAPVAGNLVASKSTGHALTYTFYNSNGTPMANQSVAFASSSGFTSGTTRFGADASLNSSAPSSASKVTGVTTNSKGQATIYVSDTTATDTGTVSATAGGVTVTSGTQTIVPAALASYKVTQSSGGGHIIVTAYDKYSNVQTSTTSAYVYYTAAEPGTVFTAGTLVTAGNTTITANGSGQPDAITLSKGTATLAYTPSADASTTSPDPNVTDTISAQSKGGSIKSNTFTKSGL